MWLSQASTEPVQQVDVVHDSDSVARAEIQDCRLVEMLVGGADYIGFADKCGVNDWIIVRIIGNDARAGNG